MIETYNSLRMKENISKTLTQHKIKENEDNDAHFKTL